MALTIKEMYASKPVNNRRVNVDRFDDWISALVSDLIAYSPNNPQTYLYKHNEKIISKIYDRICKAQTRKHKEYKLYNIRKTYGKFSKDYNIDLDDKYMRHIRERTILIKEGIFAGCKLRIEKRYNNRAFFDKKRWFNVLTPNFCFAGIRISVVVV